MKVLFNGGIRGPEFSHGIGKENVNAESDGTSCLSERKCECRIRGGLIFDREKIGVQNKRGIYDQEGENANLEAEEASCLTRRKCECRIRGGFMLNREKIRVRNKRIRKNLSFNGTERSRVRRKV
ncbi:hypothetical protein EVAR_23562_1 [Eumeta japonica]|uniref:Uncharacterized protein n=1 Tax=Eumeta variegata TaxID=151549 RepID=A0A4C1WWM8_EUMVA|nr:hypothetical protein EVAR_23562_1 [Eumeta japonica]